MVGHRAIITLTIIKLKSSYQPRLQGGILAPLGLNTY